jgi:hypothetical protein
MQWGTAAWTDSKTEDDRLLIDSTPNRRSLFRDDLGRSEVIACDTLKHETDQFRVFRVLVSIGETTGQASLNDLRRRLHLDGGHPGGAPTSRLCG